MTDNAKVDVAAVINDSEISRFQYLIFTICVMIMMCDGFDTQALAYVAPSIASEWKLSPGVFGPIFAAVLLGSMVGAFTFGYLADRFGRKRTLVLCMIVFGALNIGSAYAASIESFTLLRFLCGIGLGGAIPNVMALASEYAPARKRARKCSCPTPEARRNAAAGAAARSPSRAHRRPHDARVRRAWSKPWRTPPATHRGAHRNERPARDPPRRALQLLPDRARRL